MVNYFNLVHAAKTATPPPGLDMGSAVDDRSLPTEAEDGTTSTPSGTQGDPLMGVGEKRADATAGRKAVEVWRRELLREMLRSELGFNTVVKNSSLPGGGAGLGLFVEGSAPEGAVVAIYPVRPSWSYILR